VKGEVHAVKQKFCLEVEAGVEGVKGREGK
jgi:hypothetical protein